VEEKNEQERRVDMRVEISLTCMKWLEHLNTNLNVMQHKGGGGKDREQEEEVVFKNWLPLLSPLAGRLCEEFVDGVLY
jgi:hypothetical protein